MGLTLVSTLTLKLYLVFRPFVTSPVIIRPILIKYFIINYVFYCSAAFVA